MSFQVSLKTRLLHSLSLHALGVAELNKELSMDSDSDSDNPRPSVFSHLPNTNDLSSDSDSDSSKMCTSSQGELQQKKRKDHPTSTSDSISDSTSDSLDTGENNEEVDAFHDLTDSQADAIMEFSVAYNGTPSNTADGNSSDTAEAQRYVDLVWIY
jgi:hypothetical protein